MSATTDAVLGLIPTTTLPPQWWTHPLAVKAFGFAGFAVAVLLAVAIMQRVAVARIDAPALRYRMRKLIQVAALVLIVAYGAALFSGALLGLGLALGVLGAAVAFGLREVIASLVAWLAIASGGTFRVGDRIRVGDVTGDVVDVGPLRTTLLEVGGWIGADQHSGRLVRIDNAQMLGGPVFNYTSEFPFVWDEVSVPVRYGSDLTIADQVLHAAAEAEVGDYAAEAQRDWARMMGKFRIGKQDLAPQVTMRFDENWITFTLRYVVAPRVRRGTASRVSRAILDGVATHRDRLAIASSTLDVAHHPATDPFAQP